MDEKALLGDWVEKCMVKLQQCHDSYQKLDASLAGDVFALDLL